MVLLPTRTAAASCLAGGLLSSATLLGASPDGKLDRDGDEADPFGAASSGGGAWHAAACPPPEAVNWDALQLQK